MNKTDPRVTAYINHATKWQPELRQLRTILTDCGLTEALKWNKPSYLFENHIVVTILPLTSYCALLFLKGGLLKNGHDMLIKPGPNSEAGRQIRFTNIAEIRKAGKTLKTLVNEAIAIEKSGLKITPKKISQLYIPDEFQRRLHEMPDLQAAFNALTLGRQKAYIFYFSAPKQAKTREARIDAYVDQILDGIGLHDEYTHKIMRK